MEMGKKKWAAVSRQEQKKNASKASEKMFVSVKKVGKHKEIGLRPPPTTVSER